VRLAIEKTGSMGRLAIARQYRVAGPAFVIRTAAVRSLAGDVLAGLALGTVGLAAKV
jgi:hypothetical protein